MIVQSAADGEAHFVIAMRQHTAFAGFETQRHRGIEALLALLQTTADTLHIAGLATQRHFALGIGVSQFAP